jgi:hypothetical protein
MNTESLVSPGHLAACERFPLDRVRKVLTHLGTPLDMKGEPMSRIGEESAHELSGSFRAGSSTCCTSGIGRLEPVGNATAVHWLVTTPTCPS